MERIEQYRQFIRKLLTDQVSGDKANLQTEVESQLIFDTEHDRYQLLDVGWEDLKRVHNCFIHILRQLINFVFFSGKMAVLKPNAIQGYALTQYIDIKNSKIWIQRNMTEADLAQELVEMGVPKEDIILGLHPTYKRPYTGYGVA